MSAGVYRHKVLWTIASWATQQFSQNLQPIPRCTACCNNLVMEVSNKLVRLQGQVGACDHQTKQVHHQTRGAVVPANCGVHHRAVILFGATLALTAMINNVLRPVLWIRTYPETFWEVSRCRVPHGGAVSLVRRPSLLLHDTSIIFRIDGPVLAMKLLKSVPRNFGSNKDLIWFFSTEDFSIWDSGIMGAREGISWISRLLACAVLSPFFDVVPITYNNRHVNAVITCTEYVHTT